jgi:hypothetical protein
MQLLLADIVWRTLRDWHYVVAVVLMTEAAPDYGLMAKLAPDTALIPCELIMVWSLVRLTQSGDQRWWLPAGLFGGLALTARTRAGNLCSPRHKATRSMKRVLIRDGIALQCGNSSPKHCRPAVSRPCASTFSAETSAASHAA